MLDSTQRSGWLPAGKRSVGLLLLVTAAFLATGCVQVQAADGGFVMGHDIVVEKGETARDDIVAVGGNVRIDGRARGEVVVVGGRLLINGEVDNNVSCIGGTLVLGPGARIGGDAVVIGGSLQRHDSARIDGEFVNVSIGTGFWNVGWHPWSWGGWWGFTPFAMFWRTTQLFYWLLLALLTVALVGDRVSSASHAISREPLRLGAIGLVGIIGLCCAFVVLVLLSFLIIGIPFLLALIFASWLAYIFGVVAVFQAVGTRVMHMVGRPDASQIAIVLAGGMVMGILHYAPFFGGLLWFLAVLVGFGSVFATRFGTGRPWVQRQAAAPMSGAGIYAPPVSPESPAPPAGGGMEFDEPTEPENGFDNGTPGEENRED